VRVNIFFDPRDLRIGVFWERRPSEYSNWLKGQKPELEKLWIYICFLPAFIIRVIL